MKKTIVNSQPGPLFSPLNLEIQAQFWSLLLGQSSAHIDSWNVVRSLRAPPPNRNKAGGRWCFFQAQGGVTYLRPRWKIAKITPLRFRAAAAGRNIGRPLQVQAPQSWQWLPWHRDFALLSVLKSHFNPARVLNSCIVFCECVSKPGRVATVKILKTRDRFDAQFGARGA